MAGPRTTIFDHYDQKLDKIISTTATILAAVQDIKKTMEVHFMDMTAALTDLQTSVTAILTAVTDATNEITALAQQIVNDPNNAQAVEDAAGKIGAASAALEAAVQAAKPAPVPTT